ncbi:MAG: TonB family protein [Shimia sp.]|uniref:TonB family protein n=1 Tax=Shimia sp. TaxID=1954381 RepID=UPI0040581644
MTAVVPVMSPSAVPVAPQNSPSVVMAETSQDAPPLPMASPAPPTLVPAKPTPSAKADATKADTSPPKQKTELAEEKPKPKEQATKSPAKSSQASRQQSARQAKGSGGTIAKGTEGAEKAASLSDSKRTSLLRKWSGQIRARLAQKAPKGAGKGTAVVRINVSADGRLLGVRLVKSSGNKNVDRLALNAVKKIGRLPKAPAKLQVKSQQFDIPLKSK